jgi:hypothetical protein
MRIDLNHPRRPTFAVFIVAHRRRRQESPCPVRHPCVYWTKQLVSFTLVDLHELRIMHVCVRELCDSSS